MTPPWGLGYGPGETGGHVGGGGAPPYLNCCLDKDNPDLYVTIYPLSMTMDCGDTQTFMVEQYNPVCAGSHFTWYVTPDAGTLVVSGDYQVDYTAPVGGEECPSAVALELYCDGVLVDSVTITFNTCPAGATISPTTQQMECGEDQILTVVPGAPGCGTPTYDWEITAADETHIDATGPTYHYYAPETNPNCDANPTIKLSCGGVLLSTLKIAINGDGASPDATWIPTFQSCHQVHLDPIDGLAEGPVAMRRCDGTLQSNDVYQGPITVGDCAAWTAAFLTYFIWYPNDKRTPAQKAAGCCPPELL